MRRLHFCATFLALLPYLSPLAPQNAAAQDKLQAGSPPDASAVGSAAAGYVGEQTCAMCHSAEADEFSTNPHAKLVFEHGGKGVTCESCHGPGKAHVDSGGTTEVFDFTKALGTAVDAKCLSCHAGVHPNFERSPHARAGLSCLSCHSVHHAEASPFLLTAEQPQLCFQCHADVKPNFDMPFHHPVNEGAVKCSDCHDVHGTFQNDNLRITADQNAICTKCHMDVRGPFVYEHPAVKAEGCLACHSPHGSQNARMLVMPAINMLCNQCHSRVANATIHGMGAGTDALEPCTSCHTYIHGSNINAAFLR